MKHQRIFLIGFMGAGKTSYAGQLAEALGWSFFDSDAWIETESNKTIPRIFSEEGEPVFRQWETEALKAMIEKTNGVIATGGGLPLNPIHQKIMRDHGLVVWLNTGWDTILNRLQNMNDRPLVDRSKGDWQNQLRALYESRLPAYRCAHLVIDPEGWSPGKFAVWLRGV